MSEQAFVQAFRLQNFMGFEDTGWVELRPITLLFGRNSSGKSALMRALLLMRQSVLFPSEKEEPFSFVVDGGADFGSFDVLVQDHDIEKSIFIWFRCAIPQAPPPEKQSDEKQTEHTRPGDLLGRWLEGIPAEASKLYQVTVELQLEYRLHRSNNSNRHTVLQSIDLMDSIGDSIFRASRPAEGNSEQPWQVNSQFFNPDEPPYFPGILPGEMFNIWQSLIVYTKDSFLPRLRVLDEAVDLAGENEGFGEDLLTVYTALDRIRLQITDFLQTLNHLGPVRAIPQRFYYLAGRSTLQDSTGKDTFRWLAQIEPEVSKGLGSVASWMEQSTLRVTPLFVPINEDKGLYELVFIEEGNQRVFININEVGSGLAQVLPVVVNTLLTPKNGMSMVEQPELHLHPGAQAQLGDLFIHTVNQRGGNTRFLIETHSEHLLLRLRRYVAESSIGQIPKGDPQYLQEKDLALYFVDRPQNESTVEEITINQFGELDVPERFRGFFADDATEVAKLARARLKGKRER